MRCDTLTDMRDNPILRAGCAAWCAAMAITSLHGQQRQIMAHVLDVKGEWRLDGATGLVAAGQGLIAGTKIMAGSNRPDDSITIVRDEDLSRQRTACDASATNPCRNPIVVNSVTVSTVTVGSQLMSMAQAAIAVLLDRPPAIANHYALTLTRGKESVAESEVVIALDPEQGVVLPPAPTDMPAGHYTVSITRAGEKPPAAAQEATLTSEGVWLPLAVKAAGLYEATIVNADEEQVADVMLLLVSPAQYPSEVEAFKVMKSHTATWTGPSARADEHLFLRGFLLSEYRP